MILFDTHAHLDQDEFQPDRAAVIARAEAAGLIGMLAVGIDLKSSQAALALAEAYPAIHAAVGIQPNYAAQAQPDDWEAIVRLASHPRVAAIGETGLDRYWDFTPFEVQQDYFARHLALARELALPFVVHTRDCDADVLQMLRAAAAQGPLCGVMHSFCGTWETAESCLSLGLYISFAGMLTYKKSQALREVAAKIPADRLLVETDSPYLAPQPVRGKRNEPAFVAHTLAVLADVRGVSPDQLAEQTTANARKLFNR